MWTYRVTPEAAQHLSDTGDDNEETHKRWPHNIDSREPLGRLEVITLGVESSPANLCVWCVCV